MPRTRRRLAITTVFAVLAAFAGLNTFNESDLNTFVIPRPGTPVDGLVDINSPARVEIYCVMRGGRVTRISGLASTSANESKRQRWLFADDAIKIVESAGTGDVSGGQSSPSTTSRELWIACGLPRDHPQLDAAGRDLDTILNRLRSEGPAGFTYSQDSLGVAINTGLEVLQPCYPSPGQQIQSHAGFLLLFVASFFGALVMLVYTIVGSVGRALSARMVARTTA